LVETESAESWLNIEQKRYLAAPKPLQPKNNAEKAKYQALWDELNSALLAATAILKSRAKKDKRFQIPQWTIDNLHEFNSL
jgi:hypothetical protein